MATLDDILSTQKNGVVAINGLRSIMSEFLSALVPSSGAALRVGYLAVTTAYTPLVSDCIIDCTSGTFTVTLPTATGAKGQVYIVKNSGAGTITVATTSSQLIDGSATKTVAAGAALRVASTNIGWISI
jgi:hypothetical protein